MRKGFTLIELLVVIAIIAILAAILFPVFAKAREKARQTACLNNVKQIGTAIIQYTSDWDEFMPWYVMYPCEVNAHWQARIMPYINNSQVFVCPTVGTPAGSGTSSFRCNGYGVNYRHVIECHQDPQRPNCSRGRNLATIGRPSETITVTDGEKIKTLKDGSVDPNTCSNPGGAPAIYCTECWPDSGPCPGTRQYNALAIRHNGGGNYTFADGHSKWYKPQTVFSANGAARDMWGHYDDPRFPGIPPGTP